MKKIICFVMIIVVAFSVFSAINVSAETAINAGTTGKCKWKFDDSSGKLTVYGNGNMSNYNIIDNVPWKHLKIKRVVIREGVTSVGNNCFNSNFSDINYKITSVSLPNSLKRIGSSAFSACDFSSIKLKNGIKTIAYDAFEFNSKLKKITLPDKAKIVGKRYMKYFETDALISVNKKSKIYSSQNGALYNKKKTILYQYPEKSKKTSLKIPKSVKTIYKYAFLNSKLKKVSMGNKVKKIQEYAFLQSEKLQSITLSKNISVLGESVFSHGRKLSSRRLPEKLKKIPDGAFSDCNKLKKIKFPKENVINSIGDSAFGGCSSIVGVIGLPKKIKTIGVGAFYCCTNLKGIVVKNKNAKLGEMSLGYYNSIGSYDSNGHLPKPMKNFTIGGSSGSTAEKYAKKNNIKFVVNN